MSSATLKEFFTGARPIHLPRPRLRGIPDAPPEAASAHDASGGDPLAKLFSDASLADDFSHAREGWLTHGSMTASGETRFPRGTLIRTLRGEVPVEMLGLKDLILTRDRGFRQIHRIGQRAATSAAWPLRNQRPIRIAAGALGPGRPARDLLVAPEHRLLVKSSVAKRVFGADEVLVAARHLLDLPGVAFVEDGGMPEFWHVAFDRHEVVYAEGTAVEVLTGGPMPTAQDHTDGAGASGLRHPSKTEISPPNMGDRSGASLSRIAKGVPSAAGTPNPFIRRD